MVWDTIDAKGAQAGSEVAPEAEQTPAATHSSHPHGDQTRARILAVALELIADRGFAATSTREIAEKLGFTKAALYYHFRTKDDLLGALVAPLMSELESLTARGGDGGGLAARRELVVGYVDLVERHAHLIRVLSSDPSVKENAGMHAVMALFRRLAALLAGTPDPGVAERARVRAALTGVHGALVHAQPDEDPAILRQTAIEVAWASLGLSEESPVAERAESAAR